MNSYDPIDSLLTNDSSEKEIFNFSKTNGYVLTCET